MILSNGAADDKTFGPCERFAQMIVAKFGAPPVVEVKAPPLAGRGRGSRKYQYQQADSHQCSKHTIAIGEGGHSALEMADAGKDAGN